MILFPLLGRIAANGYRLCNPIKEGEVIDKQWVIGKHNGATRTQEHSLTTCLSFTGRVVGCGGFGEIYLCHEKDNPSKQYVMKVDNHNGPLYVEINFFIRAFSKNNVKNFMEEKGLEYLGIPRFIAFGTDKTANGDYRYLVMELLGEELQSVLETHRLSISVTSRIACRILGMLLFLFITLHQ